MHNRNRIEKRLRSAMKKDKKRVHNHSSSSLRNVTQGEDVVLLRLVFSSVLDAQLAADVRSAVTCEGLMYESLSSEAVTVEVNENFLILNLSTGCVPQITKVKASRCSITSSEVLSM